MADFRSDAYREAYKVALRCELRKRGMWLTGSSAYPAYPGVTWFVYKDVGSCRIL